MKKGLFILLGFFVIFILGLQLASSAPFCFHKSDLPADSGEDACLGMTEIGDYCCSNSGTVDSDYVCSSSSVHLTENGDTCNSQALTYVLDNHDSICCNECSSGVECLNSQGSLCYGGFVIDASSETETCNNIDDNCDGSIDEGNVCDTCNYGGYGYVDYCDVAPVSPEDESGEEFCSQFDNDLPDCANENALCDYNHVTGECNFDESLCTDATSQSNCESYAHPSEGNEFCAWNTYKTSDFQDSRCVDNWDTDSLCDWTCYYCDVSDVCCFAQGDDHVIGQAYNIGASCPAGDSGTACHDGDIYEYSTETFCDGTHADFCGISVQSWGDISEECENGCLDGVCIGSVTEPNSYWSLNNFTEYTTADSEGERLKIYFLPYNVIMIVEDSGLPEGSVSFEVFEKDTVFDDNIRTSGSAISGIVDANGKAVAIWSITQEDIDASLSDDNTDEDYEFYFVVNDDNNLKSGNLYSYLDLGIQEDECEGISICSNYDNSIDCNADDCDVIGNSVPSEITCGGDYDCSCTWDATTGCQAGWSGLDGETTLGTCTYTESGSDDCSDGFLTYGWQGTWTWDSGCDETCQSENADKETACETTGTATVACPAQVQLPFFGTTGIIVTIVLIVLVYIILSLKKSKPKKKKK